MTPKQYITQITAEDMRELAAVTNLQAGWLIKIQKTENAITIGIDETAFAQAINGFVRNGGAQGNALNATQTSFNPPS